MKHPQHRVLAQGLLGLFLAACLAPVAAGPLEDARGCTSEPRRLERLACFDQVFGTPVAEPVPGRIAPDAHRSERWRQAFAQAGANGQDDVVYRDTTHAAGHLVTVPALGVQPPRPLLTLQCQNNITELTLMLPSPLSAERVAVGFGRERAVWRVRDNGYVLSGGRGLPAIRTVQQWATGSDLRIDSAESEINGLVFDLSGFADAIRPLRKACGW